VPSAGGAGSDLREEADRAMYRAKLLGRNRVCVGERATAGPIVSRSATPPQTRFHATPAIGREADLTRAIAGLRQTRLLTLVGPSGIGKSRLAQEIGAASQALFAGGVVYLDFALFAEDADPVAALGGTLDVVVGDANVQESVRTALHERSALLIFDNVHADGFKRRVAALCGELIASCPDVSIVATAPVGLGCAEERVIVVPPLGDAATIALLRELIGVENNAPEPSALVEIARALGGSAALAETIAPFVRRDGAARVGARLRELGGRRLVRADLESLFEH